MCIRDSPKDDDKAVQTGDTAGSPIVPIAGLALAAGAVMAVSYTHLDVYKRQGHAFAGFYLVGTDTAVDFTKPITSDMNVESRFTQYKVTAVESENCLLYTSQKRVWSTT